ncbi:hypothetical protein PISMIDRAFT_686135 [Pisolithus microcarpus 441]|uniref:Uncharacterized protein n=1 Tax=Pisolithus microcarpus 441 TaxID=765257 RepID=A0A0C9YRZ5_9AGAM|nr:hypothetical protein PISMIDRAFT_686135 [Pisolithus microcarpus 441]
MPVLPPANTLPPWIRQHPQSHRIESAYNICLDLETWIQCKVDLGTEMEKAMIHCRILGCLFHQLFISRHRTLRLGDRINRWSARRVAEVRGALLCVLPQSCPTKRPHRYPRLTRLACPSTTS